MSYTGAIAAYKGYRNQALYALHRILKSQQQNIYFQPEKYEDLTVYKDSGKILEAIQVKDLTANLSLSDFYPEKPDSFFRRALMLIKEHPGIKIKIASFGPIGPEINNAWKGDHNFRSVVARKLNKHGLSSDDIDALFRNIEILRADETALRDGVLSLLKSSLAGGDPENAFDLLHYWLYKASEKRELITYSTLMRKINNVGRYLAERASHHQEWFTSIVPIKDYAVNVDEREKLSNEFYQGIGTQYKHILANLDIIREDKLQLIERAFQEKRIVILHGASGQGKSTIAYRYLKEFVPEKWRFEIRLMEDRQHALRIARALSGHAIAINAPMVIYVDVSPRDKGWPDLLKELSAHNNFNVLVTIREEDLKKEYISKSDFDFESMELAFDEKEAARIYEKLATTKQSGQFLSFKEAWNRFGSNGPLMEFVYLITQNESLRERLRCQIDSIRDRVREGKIGKNELDLVRMVAVASAYDARLDVRLLCNMLNLEEPARSLELFEKEYLLRQNADCKYVEGLHPIRSSILVDLLTDSALKPWIDVASACLPVIVEDDLEIFLLYSFSRRTGNSGNLFDALLSLQLKTWTALAGVFRALLWLGLSQYITENRELIRRLFDRFGAGWYLYLDFDIANVTGGLAKDLFKNLDFIPEENRKIIESSHKEQSPKENVFVYASQWISKVAGSISSPDALSDWNGLSEICFWVGHLNIDNSILASVDEQLVEKATEILPLECLADLHLALSILWKNRFEQWIENKKVIALTRFREETNTVFVEDDGETIKLHFVIGLESNEEPVNDQMVMSRSDNKFHDEALNRVKLIRRLFPVRSKYGSQGYGHKSATLEIPHDDTLKTGIPISQFPPSWGVKLNSSFHNLSLFEYRPETWREYIDMICKARNRILDSLKDLQNGIIAHYRKQTSINIFKHYINSGNWEECCLLASHLPLFPKAVVDEWGGIDESTLRKGPIAAINKPASLEGTKQYVDWQEISLNLRQYSKYLVSLKELSRSLANFYQQSQEIIVLNAMLGKAKTSTEIEQIRLAASASNIKTNGAGLATYNFAEAIKALPIFQKEFRRIFSSLMEDDTVSFFEKRESEAFSKSWNFWYRFAMHPGQHFKDPEKEVFQKSQNVLKGLHKHIQMYLNKLNNANTHVSILSENALWEDSPALWITYDVGNPINLYDSFESIINALKAAIGGVEPTSLKHYSLQLLWPTIVIIPMVKGRSLNRAAWKLNTLILTMGALSEHDGWHYMQHSIPSETWDMLHLSSWEHPRLDMANRFQSSMALFSILIAHLNDFNRLPELDEQGLDLLQTYVSSVQQKASDSLQGFFDSVAEMFD